MIEVAICDDEPLFARQLERLVDESAKCIPEPLHIRVFYRAADLLAELSPSSPPAPSAVAAPFDILFLDIELGDTTGVEIASVIRKRFEAMLLIFVSAHESYCKELFRHDTFEFLSKPVEKKRLDNALVRAYQKLKKPSRFFNYHVKNDTFRIPISEILYFESALRKLKIVTVTGEREFYGKLSDVEAEITREKVKQGGFVRVHNSLLVNLDAVEQIAKNGTLVIRGGRTVPLSRRRAGDVRKSMMAYFGESIL